MFIRMMLVACVMRPPPPPKAASPDQERLLSHRYGPRQTKLLGHVGSWASACEIHKDRIITTAFFLCQRFAAALTERGRRWL